MQVKSTKTMTQEEHLIHMWFSKKYWDSCCVDEAIDWSQHPNTLSIDEVSEYTAWKQEYLETIEKLSKLTPMNSKIYYSCRPWSAAKDNKEVVINNL